MHKRGGDIIDIQYKNLEFEIKAIDERGIFKGIASPYGNVDLGNDRVLPSVGKKNNNKKVPLLFQHDNKIIVGEALLVDGQKSLKVNGQLFLDKVDDKFTIPKAAETYTLMKRKALKFSIGYIVNKNGSEYVTENNKSIRNLKDINIMEVSVVTFPMNPKATLTSVKNLGGEKVDKTETKARSLMQIVKLKEAREAKWNLQSALNESFYELTKDEQITLDEKVKLSDNNIDEFATEYKKICKDLLTATQKNNVAKKELLAEIETKDFNFKSKKTETKDITEKNNIEEKANDDIINKETLKLISSFNTKNKEANNE